MAKKEETKEQSIFCELNSIDVNGHVEAKNNLKYLSWAWAWTEVKKRYPDATYKVYKSEDGKPYMEDDMGIMCYTEVKINGETLEMWLPVMDGANKAMKRTAYTYKVWNKYKNSWEDKTVAAATMFDINKTIMRCLTKNLAMFGLGLYIYAGEDLPDTTDEAPIPPVSTTAPKEKPTVKQKLEKQSDIMIDETFRAYASPAIEQAKSVDELKRIYNDYKELLGSYTPFLEAMTKRKKEVL